ncbi:MAG: right-handed parallel beta-helix repeat-containing protein [Candidatus Marinimicrobia bacterium]|nr:right-handed parallel beta-helix repeat-containing protein [Candidatus Neomarinimicrobiota bacterium]
MFRCYLLFILSSSIMLMAQEYPGLRETNGSDHPLHVPHQITGSVINVLDYGADPYNNDHDDRPALDQAIAIASDGDEIYFPPGYYNLNSASIYKNTAHLKLKSKVNIRGASVDSVYLISNFPLSLNETQSTRIFFGRGVNDIVIENITFTSSYSGALSSNVTVNNPNKAAPKYGISLEMDGIWRPCYNITIQNCRFSLIQSQMVRVSTSHDVVIKNCEFSKATDVGGGGFGYGISIQGEGHEIFNEGYPGDTRFNLVDSCLFIGPYIRHGIIIQYGAHNNMVRNSYFYKSGYDAIDLHGEDEYLNEIYANIVEDVSSGAGVGVGNTGSTHDASGRLNYIHSNTFIRCREGVKVYLKSPETQIMGNTADQCTRGIYLLNAPKTVVKSNELKNCVYGILLDYDNGTLSDYFGPPDSVVIADNYIHHNSYGLIINSGTNIMLGNNNIQNNSLIDIYVDESVTLIEYTGIDKIKQGIAKTYHLISAYPNPFNPSTTLKLCINDSGFLNLYVMDVTGRTQNILYDEYIEKGIYYLLWEPQNLASGVYYIIITTNNSTNLLKVTYLK